MRLMYAFGMWTFRIFMVFVHHCIVHPLLCLFSWSEQAWRIHDWTARKAWPDHRDAELEFVEGDHEGVKATDDGDIPHSRDLEAAKR